MINKNWKNYWKLAAQAKNITAEHMAQRCILKALTAKGNNKKEIAESLLRQAFTPVTNVTKLANGRYEYDRLDHYDVRRAFHLAGRTAPTIFGYDASLIMDEDGIIAYNDLALQLNGNNIKNSEPSYLFLFVRQDISKEQQAVQAAHAAFKVGRRGIGNPDETNFVLVGVNDEDALSNVVDHLIDEDKDHVCFYEPDLGDVLTAVATVPMKAHQKRFLSGYKTLTF